MYPKKYNLIKYEGDKKSIKANSFRIGDKRLTILAKGFCKQSRHL